MPELPTNRKNKTALTGSGFRYAVCSLRQKRAELAGEIADLVLQLRDRRRDLGKVDDILRIMAPEIEPATIPAKRAIRYLNVFRQGELGRLIIGILRFQNRPMTNLEIASIIMRQGGYRSRLWTAMRRRTRANLAYLEAQERVSKAGKGRSATWTISTKKGGIGPY